MSSGLPAAHPAMPIRMGFAGLHSAVLLFVFWGGRVSDWPRPTGLSAAGENTNKPQPPEGVAAVVEHAQVSYTIWVFGDEFKTTVIYGRPPLLA